MTPTHYQTGDRQPAIELIKSFLADDSISALEGFCIGNVLKYLYRYGHKGDAEGDLCKAAEYIEMLRGEKKPEVIKRVCTSDDILAYERQGTLA